MKQATFQSMLLLSIFLKVWTAGYDDTIRCEEFPEVTNFTVEQIANETFSSGRCVPFNSTPANICSRYYRQGVDTFFLPNGRSESELMALAEQDVTNPLNVVGESCLDALSRILCYYYYPPCGNTTHFQPLNAVCEDTCVNITTKLCPGEWGVALQLVEPNAADLAATGLTFLDCGNPGLYLDPIPHCCSNTGFNKFPPPIPPTTMATESTSQPNETAIVAAVSASLALLLIGGVVMLIILICCAKRSRAKKKSEDSYSTSSLKNSVASTNSSPRNSQTDGAPRYEIFTPKNQVSEAPEVKEKLKPRIRVMSADVRQISERKLLIPSRHIKLLDTVGQGEFGVVYRGHLTGWKGKTEIVAVKTLRSFYSTKDVEDLMKESKKMQRFKHPNVLNLIGVSVDSGEAPYIIIPFMANGSLLTYLRKERPQLTIAEAAGEQPIDDAQRKLLSICLQIAKGMCYLAQQKFVHRDLAARNCMIDHNFVIKVADFGLSEDIYARNYFRQGQISEEGAAVKLPVKWMALESILDGVFSEKTDVWSYGVTCWEVFSLGHTPYPAVDPFALVKFLRDGNRLDKPSNAACTQQVYELIGLCWTESPDKRPSFQELVERVNSLLEGVAGYLDFSVFSGESQIVKEDFDTIVETQSDAC